jgi:DME family drug/metabolite transporter
VRGHARPDRRATVAIAGSLAGLVLLCGTISDAGGWRMAAGVTMSLLAGAGFAALTLILERPSR